MTFKPKVLDNRRVFSSIIFEIEGFEIVAEQVIEQSRIFFSKESG